jgi:hypothetical protein
MNSLTPNQMILGMMVFSILLLIVGLVKEQINPINFIPKITPTHIKNTLLKSGYTGIQILKWTSLVLVYAVLGALILIGILLAVSTGVGFLAIVVTFFDKCIKS